MNLSLWWIATPILIPMVAALLDLVLESRARPWLPWLVVIALVAALVPLTGQVAAQGGLDYALGGWEAPLGIRLHADGLSLLMLWMTAVVGGLVGLYALSDQRDPQKADRFWPLWLLCWSGLNALYLSGDLFNLYVTLEILTLAAVALVALAGSVEALSAAVRYLLLALLASLSYLLGVALLYRGYGTLDLIQLSELVQVGTAHPLLAWAAALMVGGLLLKSAVFPLHVWLPPAHSVAPTPVSALLSALVVKATLYLLLRLGLGPFAGLEGLKQLLGVLGAGAILYGSFQALRQPRLKLVIAYSTVAQLGYLLLAFPLGSALAWGGVVLQMLAHAPAKAAMFLAAGNILKVLGHDRIHQLKDLERGLPLTLFALGLAGVTLMGLPPSGGFLAKWLLLKASLDEGAWWWAVVVLAGGLLAAGYVFRILRFAFSQERARPMPGSETRLPLSMELIPLGLALLSVALTFAGTPVLELLGIGTGLGVPLDDLTWETALPGLALLTSFGTAIIIFLLGEKRRRTRTALNLGGALVNLLLVAVILWGVYQGTTYEMRLPLLPGLDLLLRVDAFAMLFTALSAFLWLVTTLYAVGYLEGSPHRSRFFGFFGLCVAATMGVAMAGNLITFFIFYEILTLSTYPLVVHRGTRESLEAGRKYLGYTLSGSTVLLAGIMALYALTGTQNFIEGGALEPAVLEEHAWALRGIFFLLILGFGVKAALVPLHGWLPLSMVAPAPVSALLHAVAVVKAGAFGIVRVVYDVYGIDLAFELQVTEILAWLAAATILYGSVRALFQDDLKRRLAFSTVSQVSYIILGVAIAGPIATIGGVVHLVHQGLMKITLFFCAGNLAETLGVHKVSELDGAGRRMPLTMVAFTVGALGMTGVPPMVGFISKWHLGLGGIEAGEPWVIGVLVASTLLNAGYFLPILYRAWFRPAPQSWPHEQTFRFETKLALLAPPLITAALVLAGGLLAAAPFSPLAWATIIADREYYGPPVIP